MIGKVQDVMSAAIVIGAAEAAGSATQRSSQSAESMAERPAPKEAGEAQNRSSNAPGQIAPEESARDKARRDEPEEWIGAFLDKNA